MADTYEVIVWDGSHWFRADPPIPFDTPDQAKQAIAGLRGLAPAYIVTTRELEERGLPGPLSAVIDELARPRQRSRE